jgi:hypothetical protein
MLGTLLIWLSVAVAILAIVDLFLSDSQKAWLSNAVIKTWNILDEAKGWSFTDWLKEPRAAWWLAMALPLLLGLVFSAIGNWMVAVERAGQLAQANDYLMTDDYWIWMTVAFPLMIALSCFIFAFLTQRIFAWLLKLGSLRRLAKIYAITYLVLGIIYGLLFLMLAFEDSLKESALAKAVLITCLFLTLPLTLLIFCLLTIFAARGLAYLASGIFYTGEFIVRRIAEYPKGPVLALSALCGGIVALIKAFG